MRLRIPSVLLLLALSTSSAWADTGTSDSTLSITPSAVAAATILASDENSRNNTITTWANAHDHDLNNTTNFGDGTAGDKSLCADAANSTDSCIRFNDTAKLWTVDNPIAGTFNQIATITGTVGLTSGGVLVGDGTASLQTLAVQTNGQLLIGDGTAGPTLATLTAGSGVSITNGAGSITVGISDDFVISGWCFFDGTACAPSCADQNNVSSITDNGTGDYSINWNTDFASANYVSTCFVSQAGSGLLESCAGTAQAAGSVTFIVRREDSGAAYDPARVSVMAIGNQ